MSRDFSDEPLRVGIVDDDPEIVKVLRMVLETKGFQALGAFSGLNGLRMTKKELPDVVLLDIMMPDMDGFEVCRRIRLDPATKDIPVVLVSARTDLEHVEKGLLFGAQGYISKPFHMNTLIDKIYEVTDLNE
ncbi:MAG: response regulator [Actinobacteria bacterium]|nr:response regulator [Actinomycetota bacterium]